MRNKTWQRPSAADRAEHVRTLTRLAERILDRSCPIPVWFVLLSGFSDDDALTLER